MDSYKDETDRLEKLFGRKTPGEIEEEMGINRYNNTGVGFGYLGMGKLPENREEAMKNLDPSKINELIEA